MISCIEIFLQFRFQKAIKLSVYGSLFIKITCWLFLKLPKASVVIGTINNSQFTNASCLSFHVQAFLSFLFVIYQWSWVPLLSNEYAASIIVQLFHFFMILIWGGLGKKIRVPDGICLQFQCLISNALNFNAFLHRGIQNIYIWAA